MEGVAVGMGVGTPVVGASEGAWVGDADGASLVGDSEGWVDGATVGGVGAGVAQSPPSQPHAALSHAALHFPL